ncbi:carbohydrate sulfotransferase 14-like [Penaeus indicus]|uniref:carbohydrate sulfotransferase 14-like n=1 Tax=Penaeus indicus TaxID=29960 RepID=UPI00300D542E
MVTIRAVFFKFLLVIFFLVGSYFLVFTTPRAISHLIPFTETLSSTRWKLFNDNESGSSVNVRNDYYRYDTQYKILSENQPTADISGDAFNTEAPFLESDQSLIDNEIEAMSLFTKYTTRQDQEAENREAEGEEERDQDKEDDLREDQEEEDQEETDQEVEGPDERDQMTEDEEEWDQEREDQEEGADVREDRDEEVPAGKDLNPSANPQASQEITNSKSASASNTTIRNFQETMRERFKLRRAVLQATCAKARGSLPAQARRTRVEALFFVKKYNFLTCLSPKVGTTTWKTHLLRMWGYKADFKTPHKFNQYIGIGYNKSLRKTYRSSTRTTRVVTVRHPLSRLASAFRNKLGDGVPTVPPSHHIYDIFRRVLGHAKIRAFRRKPNKATFLQFLDFVISEAKSSSINPHWRPYLWTCQPCGIPYDYIVKLETFSDDLLYLAAAEGIREINTDLRENQSPALEEKVTDFEEYFQDLPRQVLKDIYQIYKYDFLFFGYDVPEAMLKASQEDT